MIKNAASKKCNYSFWFEATQIPKKTNYIFRVQFKKKTIIPKKWNYIFFGPILNTLELYLFEAAQIPKENKEKYSSKNFGTIFFAAQFTKKEEI